MKVLRKKIERAMMVNDGIALSPEETLAIYLALARLRDLEQFGRDRDWSAIRRYCPKEDPS